MILKVVYIGERSDFVEDKRIIDMLFARSESALSQIQKQFGAYCMAIAQNVLGNDSDAQECVNDTYLRVWESIPPNHPKNLSVYIGRIARNISLNRLKRNLAQRRNSSADLVLEELSDIVSDTGQEFSDSVLMKMAINSFLEKLSAKDRKIFMQRYWYMYSINDIAGSIGKDENYVSVKLHRLRAEFKTHLEKEGIEL